MKVHSHADANRALDEIIGERLVVNPNSSITVLCDDVIRQPHWPSNVTIMRRIHALAPSSDFVILFQLHVLPREFVHGTLLPRLQEGCGIIEISPVVGLDKMKTEEIMDLVESY